MTTISPNLKMKLRDLLEQIYPALDQDHLAQEVIAAFDGHGDDD